MEKQYNEEDRTEETLICFAHTERIGREKNVRMNTAGKPYEESRREEMIRLRNEKYGRMCCSEN